MKIDLNCDMGELADTSHEAALMQYITSANIACGGHAGDRQTMERTVRLALARGVRIGAHPGYPDRENFGRLEMAITAEAIAHTVCRQVERLHAVVAALGGRIVHVKPHGALYNVAVKNAEVARAIARGVARWQAAAGNAEAGNTAAGNTEAGNTEAGNIEGGNIEAGDSGARNTRVTLFGLAASPMLDVWREMGMPVAGEAFADRRYEPDGTLRSRQFADALITDPVAAAAQALRFARAGQAQTICVHGDTPGAVAILKCCHEALKWC